MFYNTCLGCRVLNREKSEEDEFYAALGRAISEFAEVEDQLYVLYGEIMKPQIWKISSATYHVSKTFDNKRELVRTALEASYDSEINEYTELHNAWKKIDNDLQEAGKKRNKIAHLPVVDTYGEPLHIRPSFFNAKSMMKGDYRKADFNYDLAKLQQLRNEFNKLVGDIRLFVNELPLQPQIRRK